MADDDEIIGLEIAGNNDSQWEESKSLFQKMIDKFFKIKIDKTTNSTIGDEKDAFAHEILSFGKQKLKSTGIENALKIAEIQVKYSEFLINMAEVRKRNAEAAKIENEVKLQELQQEITANTTLLKDKDNPDTVLFIKNTESLGKSDT